MKHIDYKTFNSIQVLYSFRAGPWNWHS
jgi:hypothetical protein